jgi:hypothetical protein
MFRNFNMLYNLHNLNLTVRAHARTHTHTHTHTPETTVLSATNCLYCSSLSCPRKLTALKYRCKHYYTLTIESSLKNTSEINVDSVVALSHSVAASSVANIPLVYAVSLSRIGMRKLVSCERD